jgi:AI-2 transport protein TqsA
MRNAAYIILVLFGIVVILKIGQTLLFPIIFALLIYFLIRSFRRFYDRSAFVKEKVPVWLKNGFSSIVLIGILFFIVKLLLSNIHSLVMSFAENEKKIDKTVSSLTRLLGKDLSQKFVDVIHQFDPVSVMDPIISSLTSLTGTAFMMIFYLIFLFLEEVIFLKKVSVILGNQKRFNDTKQLLSKMEHSITQYIGLKTLISSISGLVCFLIVLAFGIDSPFFWAFLIFIMNFIPVVGAIIAVFIPTVYAFIQFGDIGTASLVFVLLGSVQAFVGNFLEPKMMGNSLNISPFVALFALAFWGALWGIIGMVVSVPITVILIILLAHFEQTKPVAIFLSQNGEV